MPRPQREIKVGIIGLGLMGREIASAIARWCHLLNLDFVPRLTAICDTNESAFDWYNSFFDTIKVRTTDYHDLLDSDEVEVVYCAVPHNLHTQFYTDIIRSGKHLLGEKPFGINLESNRQILAAIEQHPGVLVRCSSEFPFYPAAQRIVRYIHENRFGKIIEVSAGLLHSSDLDPTKKINWKRMAAVNGEYGCMGDLGLHPLHIPLRAGWMPQNVRGMLSKIVTERPDASGKLVPCDTWDNATIIGEVETGDQHFPMTIQTYRIAPGETNTWYLRVIGTAFSAEYSTKYTKTLKTMEYAPGKEQEWRSLDLTHSPAYPTITAGIVEFGFSNSLLQMLAAFCDELVHGRAGMKQPFYCATPEETVMHHQILTAALESGKRKEVVAL